MKLIVQIGVVILLAIGGHFIYQKYVANQKIQIIENIEHELSSTDEYVFSRDNLKFSETQNNSKLLAHINYLYTWEASVPFGFKTKDMKISYDKGSKKLKLTIRPLRLFPLTLSKMKKEVTSDFLWFDKGDPAAKFWAAAPKHTKKLVNKEYKSKPALLNTIKETTRNSMIVKINEILNKLGINDINVDVDIQGVLMYNKKRVS